MDARDVAVVVGSLRKESFNRKVAIALAESAPSSLKLSVVEIGDLPLYNQDVDSDPPAVWTAFRKRIKAADANNDGKISKDEAPALIKDRFDRIDSNSDGFVDDAEVREMLRRMADGFGKAKGRPEPKGDKQ